MKLTHIDNACCIYEANGFKLLADPWLTDGAFEGSWFHYPPLVTTPQSVKDVHALYISHLHPDHFDEKTLIHFRKDIPIIVLDHGANFLHRKLKELDFTNLLPVKDKQTISVGPLEVTLYAPFVTHPFDNSTLGNFIDSAIVVEANGKVILNANDNTPDKASGKMLYERHGAFTVAQLKDSLASPYPSCFRNLTDQEKLSEASRLVKRQLKAMCEVATALKAEWFQPFAGDYQLGGKLAEKNKYLGVAGKKYAAEFIAAAGIKPLILNEGGSIDLITGELKQAFRHAIIPYQTWLDKVKKIPYEYESDPEPDPKEMHELVNRAVENLRKKQEQFNYFPDTAVSINIYAVYLGNKGSWGTAKQRVDFSMDNRLLYRILTKKAHWNNAEVGCHIDINRVPNVYDPDLVTMMSFFHA